MDVQKIHFMFEPGKEPAASFAQGLIGTLGQYALNEADVIVCVGGDGLLLRALPLSQDSGKPVYGITPPTSNSRGFWMEHGVNNATELLAKLAAAESIPLRPIETTVTFTNGKSAVARAFTDVAIERNSGQAALMNLTATFNGKSVGPFRIMGDGFIFATAFGSTGLSRSYNGPSVNVRNNVMVLTGKGTYEPRGTVPIVSDAKGTVFSIHFGSAAGKRPLRIDYDGLTIKQEPQDIIESMTVRVPEDKAPAQLLVTSEPALKAFSSFAP
jgi:NAD kinase